MYTEYWIKKIEKERGVNELSMVERIKKKNISRRISILLACLLGVTPALGSMSPGLAGAESYKTNHSVVFRDIDGSYAKEAILKLKDSGVVSGEGDGKFYPKRVITRAEASKFIVLALGLEQDPMSARAFKDVPKESWYAGYVGALAKTSILKGTSTSFFSPQAQVTREQLAVLFIRAMGLQEQFVDNKDLTSITDWDKVSEWAKPSVQLAMNIGFMKGIDNGNGSIRFEPKASAERQTIALLTNEMMMNKLQFIERAKGKDEKTEPNTNASTNDKKSANPPSANSGLTSGDSAANSGGGPGGGGDAGNNDNTSKPVSHTPVVTEAVYNVAGTKVSGIAEKEAKVVIYHKGKIIAEGQSDPNGNFAIDIPNRHMFLISAGDTIAITAQVDGKEVSSPLEKTVNQGRKPTSAKIYGYIDEDSGVVGTTKIKADFQDMFVVKQDGTIIECKYPISVGDESYSLEIEDLLIPYEKLSVYAMFKGLSASDPTIIEVQPIRHGKTEFTVVTSAVYDAPSYVDIRAPKYTQISIMDSKHKKLETSINIDVRNKDITRFSFDGSELDAGDTIYISANGYLKGPSDPLPITVQAAERGETPTVTGTVYSDGGVISGWAEPNSTIFIYTENGKVIRTSKVNYRGEFKTYFYVEKSLEDNEKVMITAKQVAKKESLPIYMSPQPMVGKTRKPKVPTIRNSADSIWVYAEPYSEVKIKRADGSLVRSLRSDDYRSDFLIRDWLPAEGLIEVFVTADAIGKEESDPVRVEILESETTETPIVTGDVYNINPIFSGTTVPGTEVVAVSLNGHDSSKYSRFSTDGTFCIEASGHYKPGDEFEVYAEFPGKWKSKSVIVTLLPFTSPKTDVPMVVSAAVYEDGGVITGTSMSNVRVFLKDEFGLTVDSSRSSIDGSFGFMLQDVEVMYRKKLYVTAIKGELDESDSSEVPVLPINGVTPKPTVTDIVYYSHGYSIRLTTVPHALVVVMDEQGNIQNKNRADNNGDVMLYVPKSSRTKRFSIIADGFGLERSEPLLVEVI